MKDGNRANAIHPLFVPMTAAEAQTKGASGSR